MELEFSRIVPGMRGTVTLVPDACRLKWRLREFGFVPGTSFSCLYRSAGGNLAAVEFRGTVVAMRLRDFSGVMAHVYP